MDNFVGRAFCCLVFQWLFLLSFPSIALPAAVSEKNTIGAVEDLVLLPWGVRIGARVDPGAATSSLDTCEVEVKGKVVGFTLPDRCGGAKYTLPLQGWKQVKSATGQARRPVVELEICLAGQKMSTMVTLTDRSQLEYPFLMGRNTLLQGKFIVDVELFKTSLPACSGSATP